MSNDPKMASKDAKVTLKLAADSGHRSSAEYRISPQQRGDILRICEGAELPPAGEAAE